MRVTHPTNRPNYCEVHMAHGVVAFSYETPIAFRTPSQGWTVRQNDWGPTTGRHLNYYPGDRIPSEEFEQALQDEFQL